MKYEHKIRTWVNKPWIKNGMTQRGIPKNSPENPTSVSVEFSRTLAVWNFRIPQNHILKNFTKSRTLTWALWNPQGGVLYSLRTPQSQRWSPRDEMSLRPPPLMIIFAWMLACLVALNKQQINWEKVKEVTLWAVTENLKIICNS